MYMNIREQQRHVDYICLKIRKKLTTNIRKKINTIIRIACAIEKDKKTRKKYHMPSKFKRQCNWTCDIKQTKRNPNKNYTQDTNLRTNTKTRSKKNNNNAYKIYYILESERKIRKQTRTTYNWNEINKDILYLSWTDESLRYSSFHFDWSAHNYPHFRHTESSFWHTTIIHTQTRQKKHKHTCNPGQSSVQFTCNNRTKFISDMDQYW